MGRILATLWVTVGLWAMHGLAMPGMADAVPAAPAVTHVMVMSDSGGTLASSSGCGMGDHDMCVATVRTETRLVAPAEVAVVAAQVVGLPRSAAVPVTASSRAPPDEPDLDRLCICRT